MRGSARAGDACAFVPGSDNDWNTAGNWSCGHVPTTSDQVSVGGGHTAQVGAAAQAGDLTLSDGTIQFTATVVLTIAGNYTQSAAGTLVEEIAGTTPGTQFDQLLVSGNVTLDGNLAIQSGGFTPAPTDSFKIIAGSRSGTFAKVTGSPPNVYAPRYDSDGVTLLVVPTNTVPPSIPSDGHPGDLITCDPGTWTGSPTFTFAWTSDGTPIAGETAQAYTLAAADVGHAIRCSVTAHNGVDSAPVDSNALLVSIAAPTNTVAPSIPSSGHPGDQITCNPGTWTGSPTTFTFLWTSDGTPIAGQTAQTYALAAADVGHAIRCSVTAHNGVDSTPVDSNALIVVPTVPTNIGAPSIPGSGHPGDIVTCNPGTWTGAASFAYAWTRDGTAIGATSAAYTLVDADAGHTIRCRVTAHNAGGDSVPVDSNGLAAVVAAPTSSAAPSIPAAGHTGDKITCNAGTWTGSPTFTFAWTRDGTAIASQTGSTYTLVDADAGHTIRCRVTAHNAGGDSAAIDSNALTALIAVPKNISAPSIPSNGSPGDVVTCKAGAWTGAPTLTYAWLRNDVVLKGKTGRTYTLMNSDVSQEIRCRVAAHNAGGDGEPAESNALAVVKGSPLGACAICILGAPSRTNLTASGTGSIVARSGSILINGKARVSGKGKVAAPSIGMYPRASTATNFAPKHPVRLVHAVKDPLASLPVLSVTRPCQTIRATVTTLRPGIYCGLDTSQRHVTLAPGVYVFTGMIHLGGQAALRGSGVTIYLERSGSLVLAGRSLLNVSAPTAGGLRGIAIYFDRSQAGVFSLSQNARATVGGAIYGKGASLGLSGAAALTCTRSPIAVARLTKSGKATVLVRPGA